MPPNKKLKTSKTGNEKEGEPVSKAELDSLEDFGGDWRAQCKSVQEINRYAFYKDILTDVTFSVGEESVLFHAHRLILALRSPVFEAMFFGAYVEKREDTITIPDIHPVGFYNLLGFIYFDNISFQNGAIAFKTFVAADKYCVSPLRDACEAYLYNCELVTSNVWIYFEGSQYLNSSKIKDHCLAFLQNNIVDAMQHESFLDIKAETLETVLSMDSLNISEMELLLNVVRWAENKSDADPEICLQDTLTPFLKLIRFGALSAPQFISFLETQKLKDILKDRDALDILKHIIQPSSCALPNWCCTKTSRNPVDKDKDNPDLGACSSGKSKVPTRKSFLKPNQAVSPKMSASSPSLSLLRPAASPEARLNVALDQSRRAIISFIMSSSSNKSSSSESSESGTESDSN